MDNLTECSKDTSLSNGLETVRKTQSEPLLADTQPTDNFWARLDALGREIDAQWKSDKTAVELISEQRR